MALLVCHWEYIAQQYIIAFPTSPSSPVIQTGEVIPFDFKGKIIYLTEAKLDNYHYILYGAVGFFLTYIALYLIFLRKKDKG